MPIKRKYYLLLLFITLIGVFNSFSNKDSLFKIIQKPKSDSILTTAYIELGWEYAFVNPDSSFYYGKRSLLVAKRLTNRLLFPKIYNLLGVACQLSKNYKEAISYYRESLSFAQINNDERAILTAYGNIGALYAELDNETKSLEYAFLSIAIAEKLKDSLKIANNYNNICLIYSNKKDYNNSLSYGLRALKIYHNLSDKTGECSTFGNLGNVYNGLKQYDKAYEYYVKCYKLALETENTFELMKSANELGENYLTKKDFTSALKFFEIAEKYAAKEQDAEILKDTYDGLYKLYLQKNNFKKAKEYMEKYFNSNDEYSKSSHAAEVSKKELIYEFKNKTEKDSVKNAEKDKVTKARLQANLAQIEKDRILKIGLSILAFILIAFGYFMYSRFKLIQKQKFIIEQKNKETEIQKNEIEIKNKEILASINYANRIQQGLLKNKRLLNSCFPNNFIYFNPKDIVSGDFYWTTMNKNNLNEDLFYLACCDSTGHGVPGAFISLLNMALYSEAINEKKLLEPNLVFNHIRARLIELIGVDGQQDGFDGTLICYNFNTKKITYASANNGGILVKANKSIFELNYDKMPVGKGIKNEDFNFYELNYEKGDTLYLFTDGYADQFGGPKGKKFKYKQLVETIVLANHSSIKDQEQVFNTTFEMWRGNLEQIDDVQLIGIQL